MKLIIFDSSQKTELRLEDFFKDKLTFGREDTQDIVIKDSNASRRHGFFFKKDGIWYVSDAGSTNGISVNGNPVTGVQDLYTNDYISLSSKNQAQAVRIDVVDDEYEIVLDRVHDARSTNRYLRMTSEQTEVLAQSGVIPVYESEQYGKNTAFEDISNRPSGLNQNNAPVYNQNASHSTTSNSYNMGNISSQGNQQISAISNKNNNKGLVIGVIAGAAVFLAVIIILLIWIQNLNKKITSDDITEDTTEVTIEISTKSTTDATTEEKTTEATTEQQTTEEKSSLDEEREKASELYSKLLDDYCDAMEAANCNNYEDVELFWNKYGIYGDGFPMNPYEAYGYAYKDITDDGIDELFISDNGAITSVFTVNNGKINNLINGWSRNAVSLCSDNAFYSQGSGGAATSRFETWVVSDSGDKTVMKDAYVWDASSVMMNEEFYDGEDAYKDDQFWHYTTDENMDPANYENTTYETAQKYIDDMSSKIVELKYSSFQDYIDSKGGSDKKDSSQSSTIELTDYLGTNIYTFIEMVGDMTNDQATSCIEYSNAGIVVCSEEESENIEYFDIKNTCNYSIYGVAYGMDYYNEAIPIIEAECDSMISDDGILRNYKMKDGNEVRIENRNGQIASICLFGK